jgi:hypothetical protein
MDKEGVKEEVASSSICLASAILRMLGVMELVEGPHSEHSEPERSSFELLSRLEEPRLLEVLVMQARQSNTGFRGVFVKESVYVLRCKF